MDKDAEGQNPIVGEDVHALRHRHVPPTGEAMSARSLGAAFAASLLLVVVKAALAVWGHSLAVGGDALHSLMDVGTYAAAYGAARVARRPPTDTRTYGMERSTVLAAVVNSVVLGLLGLALAGGAVLDWVNGIGTLATGSLVADGVLGLTGTAVIAGVLRPGSGALHHAERPGSGLGPRGSPGRGHDVNVRAALAHLLADAGSSLAVLAAALATALWRWPFASDAAATGIGLAIAAGASTILRDTVDMLLEAVPRSLRTRDVIRALESVPGVRGVHHVHIWSVGTTERALSGHLVVEATTLREAEAVVDQAQHVLEDRFAIRHSTLQMESEEGVDHAGPSDGPREPPGAHEPLA